MLTTIFYYSDEFCKLFLKEVENYSLKLEQFPKSRMTLSEVMTIMIYWHHSGYKNFKVFYQKHIQNHLKAAFPSAVSYNRFVELMPYASCALFTFAKCLGAECTGISFIDSTKLSVCDNKRIYSHKVFNGLAQRGKTSMGWFFGFKLHLVTDQYGNIIDFTITPGNIHDGNQDLVDSIIKKIKGILVGDKGYVGLFKHLFEQGIKLLHRLRANMQNKLISLYEKALLRSRGSIIETTVGILKDHLSLEHSRHRSPVNFFCHVCSCIVSFFFYKLQKSFTLIN